MKVNFYPYLPFRASYYALRPHKVILEVYQWAKAFIQRGLRGYADSDLLALNRYLNKWLPDAIRALKKHSGYPVEFSESGKSIKTCGRYRLATGLDPAARKKWLDVLEDIARGFEAGRNLDDDEFLFLSVHKEFKILKRGLDLFSENYVHLWK